MRCKTGCMSFGNPTQSFPGSLRTTRRAPVLELAGGGFADGGFASEAKSAATLVVVEVGDRLIADPTTRMEYDARISNDLVREQTVGGHSPEPRVARTDLGSAHRSQ